MEKYEPVKQELEILDFWKENKIHEKAKEKNKGKKQFYFLDGPPYTSGKVHLGTAWNKVLKDSVLRYKRMRGLDVWDRAGYDMHGMPTEQGTEKKLGIKHKDEIPKFGVEKFIKACREFAESNLKLMNKDFMRLGAWMDFENAYKSVDNTYMEGEWWLIKKAHENKRLYEGQKTMHWCARCATSLAKHELEYKKITDDSIFVKFPLKHAQNEFLIVWTTTPWTIPFNLGVMVHPDFDYVKAKVENEVWIVAKELAKQLINEIAGKEFKVIKEIKGKDLEGLKYGHPFADAINHYEELEQKNPKVHSVVLSGEYVTLEQGSGLVHMAPGCGPEDYEIGHRNKIPPFNNLSESGIFPENMGEFANLKAKKDDKKFVEALDRRNALVAKAKVEHDYAHCWRCKEAIIYRTTTQWFFRIEDLKEKMRELNKSIYWMPDYAGSRSFDNWLENLRDNGITRQRYWGTPLPVWRCNDCNDYIVIGSIGELEKLAGKLPEDLHKPWIDEIKIKCKCGGEKKRIPDILDVWIDAGSASWNCLDYPRRKDLFQKMFPADFILEGIDQIRGWFNLLFVASMVAMEKPSFKAVYMHGFINDAQGRKMSKSLGNYILPHEVVDKYGADTLRYYGISGAEPGLDLNYNFDDMKVKHKNLTVLWNLHNYVIDLARNMNLNPKELKINKKNIAIEEQYILSKLNSAIRKVTELFERYKLNEMPWVIEEIYLELSRTYIQLTRDKSSIGSDDERKAVLYTSYHALMEILRLFAPTAPFITEMVYQNLRKEFSLQEESIHLHNWPNCNEKLINKELEMEMEHISNAIQAALALREKIQLGVRWPLREIIIATKDKKIVKAVENLKLIIKKQANAKEIDVQEELPGIKLIAKPDYSQIGPDFGDKAPRIIAQLAIESPETILSHIEKDGKYELKAGNEKFNIVKEHLIVQRKVPEPYVEAMFKGGLVYLNKNLDKELQAEGFAREIMRRIQALRKNANLQKADKIELFIKAGNDLKEMLQKWEGMIKEKVNASSLEISSSKPEKKLKNYSKEKVREKEFELFLEKV
ncbi:isoleucine--tRNA ligase [Candidatus Woesearchaeota archaeon]|nr:isoleucine--tRNA ligase [Candidatus Woesearchaeota archaeon]